MKIARFAPALFIAVIACGKKGPPSHPDAQPARPRFGVQWSADTGRGMVTEALPDGDTLATCFHCAYPGYTGGLVIGIYDLGNAELGWTDTGFSNQANFFALDPSLPLPDFTAFANRFAHEASDVDPAKPLDNKTMTALNLGWRDRGLAPGESFTTAMALGLATTGEPGSIPRLPTMDDQAWSCWRAHLPPHPATHGIHFVAERVALDVSEDAVAVDADYVLANPSMASVGMRIVYPILVARDRPAPTTIWVDGQTLPLVAGDRGQVQAEFPLSIPPQAIRSFHVRYAQPLLGNQAVYLVTSALRWPFPIDRAVFVIKHPARFRGAALSYPTLHRETVDGQTTLVAAMQPFRPDREVVLRWKAPSRARHRE